MVVRQAGKHHGERTLRSRAFAIAVAVVAALPVVTVLPVVTALVTHVPASAANPPASPEGDPGAGLFEQATTLLDEGSGTTTVQAIARGDLDGDAADEVVAIVGGPAATVLQLVTFDRDVDGLHETARYDGPVGSDTSSTSLVLSDVDDDGELDAVYASANAQEVLVRLGDGVGGLGESTSVSLALSDPADDNDPMVIRTAQLDGDAQDEIVVLAEDSGTDPVPYWVLDPTSDGFDIDVGYLPASFNNGAVDIAAADLDGVGPDEVVVVPGSSLLPVLILEVGASGTLDLPPSTDCGTAPARNVCTGGDAPGAIQFADIDDDGDIDLVLGAFSAYHVGVNDGTGAFAYTQVELGYSVPFNTSRSGDTGPVDLDGDGFDDVLFAPRDFSIINNNVLATGFGDGEGGLDFTLHVAVPGAPGRTVPPGEMEPNGAGSVLPVEATGDGRLDVIVGAYIGQVGLALHVGDGSRPGGFASARIDRAPGDFPFYRDAFALADMNGDGRDDWVGVDDSDRVVVQPGQTDGALGDPIVTDLGGAISCDYSIAVGDIDGDGALDLACAAVPNGIAGQAFAVFGDGAGGVTQPVVVPLTDDADGRPEYQSIRIADLDGDGRSEVVVGHRANVEGVANTSLVSILGAPLATPRDLEVVQQVAPVGATATTGLRDIVVVGDVTGDQVPDIVFGAETGVGDIELRSMLATLPGLGDRRVGAPREMRLYGSLVETDLAIGDIDRDGRDDLVAIDSRREGLGVFLSTGDGFFDHVQVDEPFMDSGGSDIELADVDGDGNLDILATNATNSRAGLIALHVHLGRGDGTFAEPFWPTTGSQRLQDVAVGDVDGKGTVDLVGTWGNRTVLRGLGDAPVRWQGPFEPVVHGTVEWSWVAPPATTPDAEIRPFGGGTATPLTVDTTAQTATIDTTSLDDGDYVIELSADERTDEFRVDVRNDAVTWHDGAVTADETWAAGTVHLVDHVTVADAGSVTIDANAIVKVLRGGSIVADDASMISVAAGAIVTSVDDPVGEPDLAGLAADGSWNGITDRFGLPVVVDGEVRHEAWRHRSPLDDDLTRTWTDEQLHLIDGEAWTTGDPDLGLVVDAGAVVKFDVGASLNVDGDLSVTGTPDEPATFTSIHDDQVGGDTDGIDRAPQAGDWLWLQATQVVDVDGARFSYGSGPYETYNTGFYGMLQVTGFGAGAATTIRNSTFADGASGGLAVLGAPAIIDNTVVTRTTYGIVHQGNPGTTVTNATLHDNDNAISSSYTSSGNPVVLRNSTVSDYDRAFRARFGSVYVASDHNNVFSDRVGAVVGSGNFSVGTNGNIAERPEFVATTGPDAFELRPGSPLIDAADGSVAPSTDLLGRARTDDPAVADTGIADGDGVVPDIGAFEGIEETRVLPDLNISQVTAPDAIVPGADAELTYVVTNTGDGFAFGELVNQVRLVPVGGVPETTTTSRVTIEFRDPLGAGETRELTSTVAVPASLPGDVRFEVILDIDDDLFEVAENVSGGLDGPAPGHVGLSDPVSALTIDSLVRDAPATTFDHEGITERWYSIPDGGPVRIEASGPFGSNVRIYTQDGDLPTTVSHDDAGSFAGSTATLDAIRTTDTFVLVRATGDAGEITVEAIVPPPTVTGMQPALALVGPQRIVIEGRFLGDVTDVVLRRGAVEVSADEIDVDPATGWLSTVFAGDQLGVGVWDVEVRSLRTPTTSAGTLELIATPDDVIGAADALEISVVAPPAMRRGRSTTVQLRYQNTSEQPIALPVISIEASSGLLSLWDGPQSSSLTLVPPGSSVLPFLLPGEQASLPLTFDAPDAQVTITFDVWAESPSDPAYGSTPVDWDRIATEIPAGVTPEVWTAIVDRDRAAIGGTFADLAESRGAHYTLLRLAGEDTPVFVDGTWRLPPLPPSVVTTGVRQVSGTAPALRAIVAQAIPSGGSCSYSSGPLGLMRRATPLNRQADPSDPPIPSGPQVVVVFIAGSTHELKSGLDSNTITSQIEESIPGVIVRSPIRDASEAEILAALKATSDQLDDDDQLFIFNSSHGTQNNELVTTNGDLITPQELLGAYDKEGLEVTFITDSCYSDGFTKELADEDGDVVTMSSAVGLAYEVDSGGPLITTIRDQIRRDPGSDLGQIPQRQQENRDNRMRKLGYTEDQIDEFNRTGRLGTLDREQEATATIEGADPRFVPQNYTIDSDQVQDVLSRMDSAAASDYETIKRIRPGDRTPEQVARLDEVLPAYSEAYEEYKVDRTAWRESEEGRAYSEADDFLDRLRTAQQEISRNDFSIYGDDERIARGISIGKPTTSKNSSNQEEDEAKQCPTGVAKCPDDSDDTDVLTSYDPNDKTAFAGDWAMPDETLDYQIRFENDAELAQVPAQEVVVTDVLDADLDLDTVELVSVGFGDVHLAIPPGRSSWSRRIATIVQGRIEHVDIDISLDRSSRTITWRLTSVDPDTDTFPVDPFAGFLPPNDGTGVGEGSMLFHVDPLPGRASGTHIDNVASIVFDTNDAIITNSVRTTLDDDLPTVTVDPLPTTTETTDVDVSWTALDTTSGVELVDVHVSVDGGPYALWQRAVADRSATWSGADGSTVRFVARATDRAGNPEPPDADAEAVTRIELDTLPTEPDTLPTEPDPLPTEPDPFRIEGPATARGLEFADRRGVTTRPGVAG